MPWHRPAAARHPPQAHLGTKNCTASMERCVYRRRSDGIFVFNLGKTWEKLQLAARIIVAIENPQDIVAISARPYGQRAVLKFANYTGARATVGRHTPGAPHFLQLLLLLAVVLAVTYAEALYAEAAAAATWSGRGCGSSRSLARQCGAESGGGSKWGRSPAQQDGMVGPGSWRLPAMARTLRQQNGR